MRYIEDIKETPFPSVAVNSFRFNFSEKSEYGFILPVSLFTMNASYFENKTTSSDIITSEYCLNNGFLNLFLNRVFPESHDSFATSFEEAI